MLVFLSLRISKLQINQNSVTSLLRQVSGVKKKEGKKPKAMIAIAILKLFSNRVFEYTV